MVFTVGEDGKKCYSYNTKMKYSESEHAGAGRRAENSPVIG